MPASWVKPSSVIRVRPIEPAESGELLVSAKAASLVSVSLRSSFQSLVSPFRAAKPEPLTPDVAERELPQLGQSGEMGEPAFELGIASSSDRPTG